MYHCSRHIRSEWLNRQLLIRNQLCGPLYPSQPCNGPPLISISQKPRNVPSLAFYDNKKYLSLVCRELRKSWTHFVQRTKKIKHIFLIKTSVYHGIGWETYSPTGCHTDCVPWQDDRHGTFASSHCCQDGYIDYSRLGCHLFFVCINFNSKCRSSDRDHLNLPFSKSTEQGYSSQVYHLDYGS